jgi:hypothetical protein
MPCDAVLVGTPHDSTWLAIIVQLTLLLLLPLSVVYHKPHADQGPAGYHRCRAL